MYLWWDSEIQTFLRKDCLRGNRNGWRCAFFNSSSIFDLINLESLEAQQLVVPLRKLKNTSDTQVELLSINGHTYFSKVVDFSSRKIESRLKYCFWPTRGVWSAFIAKRLTEAGISTPKPLAAGDKFHRGLVHTSGLITEALVDAQGLDRYVRQLQEAEVLPLLCRLGKFLRQIHDIGIYHGDVQLSNLYMHGNQLGVWDLDSVRLYDKIPTVCRDNDIGRLLSSFLSTRTKDSETDRKDIVEAFADGYGHPVPVIKTALDIFERHPRQLHNWDLIKNKLTVGR